MSSLTRPVLLERNVTWRRVVGGLAALILLSILSVMASAIPAAASDTDGVSVATAPVADHPDWMAAIPDRTNLQDISVPGTHDSATATCEPVPVVEYCRTQSMVLEDQLLSGVRALDIRIRARDNDTEYNTSDDYFTIAHGIVDVWQPGTQRDMTFDEVLDVVCGFLADQPTETVLMMIGDLGLEARHDLGDGQPLVNLFDDYVSRYASCLHTPNQPLNIPTLGDVRGSIVLLPNAAGGGGLPANDTFNKHGYPGYGQGQDVIAFLPEKLEQRAADAVAVMALNDYNVRLRKQNDPGAALGRFYRAQLNANTGSTPFGFASGLAGEGINEKVVEYLLGLDDVEGDVGLTLDYLGIVFADYPSASLIEAVMAHNFELAVYPDLFADDAQQAITSFSHHVRSNGGNDIDELNRTTAAFWRHVLRDDDTVHVYTTESASWEHHNDPMRRFEITSDQVRGHRHQVFVSPPADPPVSQDALQAAVGRISSQAGLNPGAIKANVLAALRDEFPGLGVSVHVVTAPSRVSPSVPTAVVPGTTSAVVWVYDKTLPLALPSTSGPYTAYPGQKVRLRAVGTTNPRDEVLRYRWKVAPSQTFTDWQSTGALDIDAGLDLGTYEVTLEIESVAGRIPVTTSLEVALLPTELLLDQDAVTFNEGRWGRVSGSVNRPGTVVVDWGDGTTSRTSIGERDPSFSLSRRYYNNGEFTVSVSFTSDIAEPAVRTATFTVLNVVPSLEIGEMTGRREGSTLQIPVYVADPGHAPLLVVYSIDGVLYTKTFESSSRYATFTHRIVDDDPTGTPTDTILFEYTISDGGDTVEGSEEITISNVAPTVTIDGAVDQDGASVIGTPVETGSPVRITASFTDPGVADTHTATIDFGSGPAPVDITDGVIDATFAWPEAGLYTVEVAVTDDDTGTGTASVVVEVADPEPADVVQSVADSITDLLNEPGLSVRAERDLRSAQRRLIGVNPRSPNSVVASLDRGDIRSALRFVYLAVNDLQRVETAGSVDTGDLRMALVELSRDKAIAQLGAAEELADSRRDARFVERAERLIALGDDQLARDNERTAALRFWRSVTQSLRVR